MTENPQDLESQPSNSQPIPSHRRKRISPIALKAFYILAVFLLGLGSGFLLGKKSISESLVADETHTQNEIAAMMHQINPPEGYTIPATFGTIGPQLIASGAIDLEAFAQLYQQAGRPLSDEQMTILTEGSEVPITINAENAGFLLNFFWAFGLTNQNPVLTEGPMMANGREQIGNYASTGGWTIGARAPADLFASASIISLAEEQQKRLVEVASAVYRPCCNNPTHYPDCNHGMAMLGLMELMASQKATNEQMLEAAKYVNAFWYPQQMLEIATFLKTTQGISFTKAEPLKVVGKQYSSGSGFQAVHQWLAANGKLEQIPNSGGSCGVQ